MSALVHMHHQKSNTNRILLDLETYFSRQASPGAVNMLEENAALLPHLLEGDSQVVKLQSLTICCTGSLVVLVRVFPEIYMWIEQSQYQHLLFYINSIYFLY